MENTQEPYILGDLPRQRLSRSQKGKKWGKTCIDELEKITYGDINYNGRSSRFKKQINYDLFNGKLDQQDFQYILNPFGFSESEFPATMQHYDIISPKVQLLMGEEIKRPFNFKVVSHDPDAISQLEEKKKEIKKFIKDNMDKMTDSELAAAVRKKSDNETEYNWNTETKEVEAHDKPK